MPAEWEPHEATWIAWPHHEPDWPGKLEPIPWVYAEIVRVLHQYERVEILCHDEEVREAARRHLDLHGVHENYRLHLVPNDRVWLRDSAPTIVRRDDGAMALAHWKFNAWAKYPNYERDARVGEAIAQITNLARVEPVRPDNGERVVLEGGAIDTDGAGTLLVTEECLLSPIQERNPGLSRADYERVFQQYLGVRQTIWLGEGCEGDDTHGHVDDVARFVAPGVIVLAYGTTPPTRRTTAAPSTTSSGCSSRAAARSRSSSFPSPAPSRCATSASRRATRTSTSRMAWCSCQRSTTLTTELR
jgi:agmatine deiminase